MNLAMPVFLFAFAKTTYRTASPKAPFVDISDLPLFFSDINETGQGTEDSAQKATGLPLLAHREAV